MSTSQGVPINKILNCLKADYDKIFKSEIITDLLKVLGCGVEVKSKANKNLSSFDMNALRWSKIILCTDADVDGFQIRTLILTMLYRLTPTLIEKGYVYIAESPLFEIRCKDETYFAYSDAEKVEILQKLGNKKVDVQRSKGLGENEPDMMWLTTMNPKTRRLIKVSPEDAAATEQMFALLLGGVALFIKKKSQRFNRDIAIAFENEGEQHLVFEENSFHLNEKQVSYDEVVHLYELKKVFSIIYQGNHVYILPKAVMEPQQTEQFVALMKEKVSAVYEQRSK